MIAINISNLSYYQIMTNEYNQPFPKRQFTIRYDEEEDGGYSGQCLEIPGAISQGETLEELKENMKDAISLILESIRKEADIQKKKSLIREV
jgi:predicted RNase H-like HicB family nuclease